MIIFVSSQLSSSLVAYKMLAGLTINNNNNKQSNVNGNTKNLRLVNDIS